MATYVTEQTEIFNWIKLMKMFWIEICMLFKLPSLESSAFTQSKVLHLHGSMAFLDLSMQEERHAQTPTWRAEGLTKGAIDLHLSYETEVRGDSPSL